MGRIRIRSSSPLIGVILWTFAGVNANAQNGDSRGAHLRELNNTLLRIHGGMQQMSPDRWENLQAQAEPVLRDRFAALSDLILNNPGEALKFAFSPELADDLAGKFPKFASLIERHGRWQGPVDRWVMDSADLKSSREVLWMKTGTQTFEVHFAGQEPAGLKNGDVIEVAGVQLGRLLAVPSNENSPTGPHQKPDIRDDNTRRRHTPVVPTTLSTSTGAACTTTGVQNTAVLLVTWPGATVPSTVTPQSAHDTFFGTATHSLDGFWREASYGQTSASGDVFGWYTLDSPYTCSQASEMLNAAMVKAAADGANFQNYSRIFVIYPNIGCTAGFAEVGCSVHSTPSGSINASTAYIEADYMGGDQGVQLATHEGGHNLGLQHSGTLDFGTETLGALGASGTVNEFGDYWSTMGSQTLGIYPAPQKAEVLNWIAPGSNYQVVQSSGTWSLQPLESSPAALQALKVQRGTGNDAWLWIEYRQPVGNYDSTLMTQPFGGALIHYEDPTTGSFTHLLNFVPNGTWNTWWSPALLQGKTWVDPYSNLSISVPSATANALTVNVVYGTTPCTNANPAVAASPLDPSTNPGKSVSYDISVTNNDSAGCSASTFSLSSSQPSGWPASFSASALTLSPGQTGLTTMTQTPPAGTPPGTYAVNANASNATFKGTGSANVTVTNPPPPTLSLSLSVPSSTYAVRQTVSVTATVQSGTTLLNGAAVKFAMVSPGGGTTTKSLTTNSTGKAIWSYKIGAKGPVGTYSVSATTSNGIQTATSNTISFTVH